VPWYRAVHQETTPDTSKGTLKTQGCPLQSRQRIG
jgi:hypothetical protein